MDKISEPNRRALLLLQHLGEEGWTVYPGPDGALEVVYSVPLEGDGRACASWRVTAESDPAKLPELAGLMRDAARDLRGWLGGAR